MASPTRDLRPLTPRFASEANRLAASLGIKLNFGRCAEDDHQPKAPQRTQSAMDDHQPNALQRERYSDELRSEPQVFLGYLLAKAKLFGALPPKILVSGPARGLNPLTPRFASEANGLAASLGIKPKFGRCAEDDHLKAPQRTQSATDDRHPNALQRERCSDAHRAERWAFLGRAPLRGPLARF